MKPRTLLRERRSRKYFSTKIPSYLCRRSYDLADAGLEIIKKSEYRTSIGDLLLCRVADSGYVQIAGPVATVHTKKMCQEMFDMGCQLILIDGAIDRKSIASPETSDAIILSTGAVLSRNLKKGNRGYGAHCRTLQSS